MSDETLSRIEGKLDDIGDSVTTLKVDVAELKTNVSAIPGSIEAAINKHQLECIQDGVKQRMSSTNPLLMPKVIVPLVGAIMTLTGLIVYLVKG